MTFSMGAMGALALAIFNIGLFSTRSFLFKFVTVHLLVTNMNLFVTLRSLKKGLNPKHTAQSELKHC